MSFDIDRCLMKELHECAQHAAEYRDMARTAQPTRRQQLEEMKA